MAFEFAKRVQGKQEEIERPDHRSLDAANRACTTIQNCPVE